MSRLQAIKDFNTKLILERSLRIRMDRYNEKIIIAVTKSVARTGALPEMEAFQSELEQILLSHYRIVGDVFIDGINQMVQDEEEHAVISTKSYHPGIETLGRRKQFVVVDKYFRTQASSVSGKITAVTKKEAIGALEIAKSAAFKPGAVSLDMVDIAGDTGATFRRRMNGRSTGLVRINTNNPAEAAKMTQISILRGEEPQISGGGPSDGTKTWNNMGDSRVRFPGKDSKFNHQNASQTVKMGEPFTVSGEKLRFPGDTSMGASLGNVVNCRCSATYDIKDVVKIRKQKRADGLSIPEFNSRILRDVRQLAGDTKSLSDLYQEKIAC